MLILKRFASVAVLWCLLLYTKSYAAQPIIAASELAQLLTTPNAVQIVDIRSNKAYETGHIPNAISAPYGQWRGPEHNPGKLPDNAYFEQFLQQLGITEHKPIVIYTSGSDQTNFGAAARVYWTLKYLGLEELSVLNGGYHQWQLTKQTETQEVAALPNSKLSIKNNPKLAIFKDELKQKVTQQNTNYQLLDARPPNFYLGKIKAPTVKVSGTIATAENVPYTQWFIENDTRLLPTVELKALVQQQGLDKAPETVTFCNTGHWGAINWFILSEVAELPNVRLYPASLTEWANSDENLPMDNTQTHQKGSDKLE